MILEHVHVFPRSNTPYHSKNGKFIRKTNVINKVNVQAIDETDTFHRAIGPGKYWILRHQSFIFNTFFLQSF